MKIIGLGDSLMQFNTASTYPQTGWFQELPRFLKDPLSTRTLDFALNGSSTKSIQTKGLFQRALEAADAGDLVLISFGHNDEKAYDPARFTEPFGTYQANLRLFYSSFAAKGAKVVFLSSVARLKYAPDGVHLLKTHGDYPQAMRQAAQELKAPFIDLETLSTENYEKRGAEAAKRCLMILPPGRYPNYPEGKNDTSHLSEEGAMNICSLAVGELKKISGLSSLFL
jgi:lysophospholipase L1-like esterase